MTASAGPVLKRLYREFGDRVGFATLYVREAHPGDRFPQPSTFEQKLEHARAYRSRDAIPWPVVVDDLDGTLHQQLDPKPTAAYVVDRQGVVAFRVLWSNVERPLRDALRAVVAGERLESPEREPKLVPMLRGLGQMDEVLPGKEARLDVLRAAPPMYGMAKLAGVLRPLPPLARGVAAMVAVMAGAAAAVVGLRRVASMVSR